MAPNRLRRILFVVCLVLAAAGTAWSATATNTVHSSHAFSFSTAITANTLKPAACAGITLADVVVGSGTVKGTSANDLILGSSADDTLGSNASGQGSDCCVGGGGTNTYRKSCVVQVP